MLHAAWIILKVRNLYFVYNEYVMLHIKCTKITHTGQGVVLNGKQFSTINNIHIDNQDWWCQYLDNKLKKILIFDKVYKKYEVNSFFKIGRASCRERV